MASHSLYGRSLTLMAMAVCLSGCPSSCQQRRTTTAGEITKVEVGRAEVEKRRGRKVTKNLDPVTGKPTQIIEETDEIDRELVELASGASQNWKAETVVNRPWWYIPVIVVVSAVVGAALSLLIRFLLR